MPFWVTHTSSHPDCALFLRVSGSSVFTKISCSCYRTCVIVYQPPRCACLRFLRFKKFHSPQEHLSLSLRNNGGPTGGYCSRIASVQQSKDDPGGMNVPATSRSRGYYQKHPVALGPCSWLCFGKEAGTR